MICISNAQWYCSEDISKIENYAEAVADPKMWDCHHRLEVQGDEIHPRKELIARNLYYHRPACELIFLTHSEHQKIHSNADQRGKRNYEKLTPEQKAERQRIRSSAGGDKMKGKKWWNNGIINKRAKECPGEGWVKGKLPEWIRRAQEQKNKYDEKQSI